MDCGACRAIPKLKMLWLDAFGTPKNPGGGIGAFRASKKFPMLYYEMRIINLCLSIVGPVGQFRSSNCFG